MPDKDEDLLQEIRDKFTYATQAWQKIREEAAKDMRYVSGKPWDAKEEKARADAGRPCLALDELGQYTNQTVNDFRQNPRSIKVTPLGVGSDDKSAELRANKIRDIERRSNAQAAYTTAADNMVNRSYGFFRIGTEYAGDESFDQEIKIKRIPNADSVLLDPDAKDICYRDGDWAFVVDKIKIDDFERKYPNAEVKNFESLDMGEGSVQWADDENVQIAEYWKVIRTKKTLVLLNDDPANPVTEYVEDIGAKLSKGILSLPDGNQIRVSKWRKVETRKVVQYITNGYEILEENEWAGKWIPLIPMFGKEIWMDEGSGAERGYMSMIRLARDPYMLYCYYRTCEAELVGQVPKAPYIGYEGQFEGHEDEWQMVNRAPIPFLQAKAILDSTGQNILPLPQRNNFEPAIGALETGAEAARRAIQAAMGISPLPTSAQRQNEKSGIALQRIQTAQSTGSYHFSDSFDEALKFCGEQLNDLLDKIYDTERTTGITEQDGTSKVVQINTPQVDPQTGQIVHNSIDDSEHGVEISTGPAFQTQREMASDFVDQIVKALPTLPVDPAAKAKLLSLSIKLKQLGPIGDEMVETITPQQQGQIPPQAQQMMAKAQQENQALNAYAQKLEKENQELKQEKQAKIIDNEYKLKIQQLEMEKSITIAEITTKAQNTQQRMKLEMDMYQQLHSDSHDLAMQKDQQAHEQGMAQQEQNAQAAQQQPEQEAQEPEPQQSAEPVGQQ
jgi:hypothetical protein